MLAVVRHITDLRKGLSHLHLAGELLERVIIRKANIFTSAYGLDLSGLFSDLDPVLVCNMECYLH